MTAAHDTVQATTGQLGAASLGLALCLMLNGVFDRVFSNHVSTSTFPLHIGTDPLSGGLGAIALCVVAVLVTARKAIPIQLGKGAAVLLSASLVIPTALLLLAHAGITPELVGEVSGLVQNASSTLLLILWASLLAQCPTKQAILTLVSAICIDTAIDLVSSLALVDAAIGTVLVLAGIASPLLLHALGHRNMPIETPAAIGAQPLLPLALSIACIALYGFVMGRIQSVGSSFELTGFLWFVSDHVVNIGALAVAGLAFGLTHTRNPHTIIRLVIFAFLIAALYLSGVFGIAIEPAGMIMMTIARFAIVVYIWLLACAGDRAANRAAYTFALGWGIFTLTNTVSTKIGLALPAEGTALVAYTLAIVGCLVALVVIEFVPRRLATTPNAAPSPAESPTGTALATDANRIAEDLFVARCKTFAAGFDLTARELEVLGPLARGRSAASIATTLGISTETARTHIRHIYQKTGIHNREELMDAIEHN